LGDGELGTGLDLALQAPYRLLESVRFGVGVQDHTGTQLCFSRHTNQVEDVDVAHGGCMGTFAQGHEIPGGDQGGFDSQGACAPEQPLAAQPIVIAGRAVQDGRFSSALLDERTQSHGAHTWPGDRVSGYAEAIYGQGGQ
jgi:hypothetical protein